MPVPAQVDLGVVVPGVDLVDGDEPPVAGERLEERAGPGSGLEDQVTPVRSARESNRAAVRRAPRR